MEEARVGDWIQTFSGMKFYIFDPRPEEICIGDIAHALSFKCRFSCHCREFYSVAQHSLMVSELMEDRYGIDGGLCGLMHDSAEAYIGDMVKPIKRMPFMDSYKAAENAILGMIYEKFQVKNIDYKSVDNVVLATEKRDIMSNCMHAWESLPDPLIQKIVPRPILNIEQEFLNTFYRLIAGLDRGKRYGM